MVLGRTGEPAGAMTLRWDVLRDGRPLLRQSVDLADPALVGWPGLVRRARVLLADLYVSPTLTARTRVLRPWAVTQRLADGAELTTVLAADAAAATAALSGTREPAAAG